MNCNEVVGRRTSLKTSAIPAENDLSAQMYVLACPIASSALTKAREHLTHAPIQGRLFQDTL